MITSATGNKTILYYVFLWRLKRNGEKARKKQFLLNPKVESYAAIIFAVGLVTVLNRILPFEWYLPSYYTDLENFMQNIVVMSISVISGILSCIVESYSAHLLACSLIAFFLIAVLYLPGLLRSVWLKE